MIDRERMEMEFGRAIARADELEAMAGELYELAKGDVSLTLTLLARSFRGENGKLFLQKGKQMAPEIFELADQMHKAASNIRFSAEVIYKAEKAAQTLAMY